MRVLVLNASLHGENGNCAVALDGATRWLAGCQIERYSLDGSDLEDVMSAIGRADALLIATGTYWDSWSSRLQLFLEAVTQTEGSEIWLGKPVAVIVMAHSVGAKGVLSRLQGVLNTLGATIPPMSGIVLSWVAQVAAEALESAKDVADLDGLESGEQESGSSATSPELDIWQIRDLEIVVHNLLEMARGGRAFRAWEVDPKNAGVWVK